MQAAPARYVSVSELYSTDEVELLLDEIRELEPTSCRGEDVQDFEIAGSGCGGGAGAGGRSPAGTELTERSWDSHAQYRRSPAPRAAPLAPVYWHGAHLRSARGAAAAAVVLAAAAAAALLWAAAGARLPARARPLALAALSSALLHAALLLLRLTRLHRLMPLDWPAIGIAACVWTLGAQGAAASALLHATLAAPRPRQPDHVAHMHIAAVGLSYVCAAAAGVLAALLARRRCGGVGRGGRGGVGRGGAAEPPARGAYRAVPPASPARASTSRNAPL